MMPRSAQHAETSSKAEPDRFSTGSFSTLVIVGPTAVGKSSLAHEIAPHLRGEIVSADSMQVYRGLDIGTDKPTAEVRKRIPYHLLDVRHPGEYYSAADFEREALQAISEILGRGGRPLVVGGTGLYIRVLLKGIQHGPSRSMSLRQRLEIISNTKKGLMRLRRILERNDPESAARIERADRRRLFRALEVLILSGTPFSRAYGESFSAPDRIPNLKVGLTMNRDLLYERINRRTDQLFRSGLTEEVRGLLDRGVSPDCNAFKALGYREALRVLEGTVSLDEAIHEVAQKTRQFAKRQFTWFRKEPGIRWFDMSSGHVDDNLVRQVLKHISVSDADARHAPAKEGNA